MPRITFMPGGKKVTVRQGTSLLAAGRMAHAGIRSRCGGIAGCLMCKVHIRDPQAVTPVSSVEKRKLGVESGSRLRLSCQAKVLADLIVDVPEDPLKAAVRRQLERLKQGGDEEW